MEAKKPKQSGLSKGGGADEGKGVVELVGEACNFHKPGM